MKEKRNDQDGFFLIKWGQAVMEEIGGGVELLIWQAENYQKKNYKRKTEMCKEKGSRKRFIFPTQTRERKERAVLTENMQREVTLTMTNTSIDKDLLCELRG